MKKGINKHGNPIWCQCGGKLVYARDFGRWFVHCSKCTPVTKIRINRKTGQITTGNP
jgi:hypothetical protein